MAATSYQNDKHSVINCKPSVAKCVNPHCRVSSMPVACRVTWMPGAMRRCQLWTWTPCCCRRLLSGRHWSPRRPRCKQCSLARARRHSLQTLACLARDHRLFQPLSSNLLHSSSRSPMHSSVMCTQRSSSIPSSIRSSRCTHMRSMSGVLRSWVGSRQPQPSRSPWRRSRLAPGPRAASSGSSSSSRRSSCRRCTCCRVARRRRSRCSPPAAQKASRPAWQRKVGGSHLHMRVRARESHAWHPSTPHHEQNLRRLSQRRSGA